MILILIPTRNGSCVLTSLKSVAFHHSVQVTLLSRVWDGQLEENNKLSHDLPDSDIRAALEQYAIVSNLQRFSSSVLIGGFERNNQRALQSTYITMNERLNVKTVEKIVEHAKTSNKIQLIFWKQTRTDLKPTS